MTIHTSIDVLNNTKKFHAKKYEYLEKDFNIKCLIYKQNFFKKVRSKNY